MIILYAALFWLPFSMLYLTFDTYGVTWTFFILCIVLLTPIAVIQYFVKSRFNNGFSTDSCIVAITLLFLFFLIISEISSSVAYRTVHGLLVPVAAYFVVKSLVRNERHFIQCLKVMIASFSLYAFGMLAYFAATGDNNRINNVFNRDSITTAALGSWAVLFALFTPLFTGIVKYAVVAINAGGVLLSLSRSLLMTTIISPIFVKTFVARKMLLILIVFFASSLLVTTSLVSNVDVFKSNNWDPSMEHSLARLTNIEYWKRSIYGRLHSFKPSMAKIENAPVFGNGFPSYRGSTVHNFHMELLEYGGIIGYALFVLIFVTHFWSARYYFQQDRFLLVGAIYILFMLINGLLNGVLHGLAPLLIFIQLGLNESRLSFLKRKSNNSKKTASLSEKTALTKTLLAKNISARAVSARTISIRIKRVLT